MSGYCEVCGDDEDEAHVCEECWRSLCPRCYGDEANTICRDCMRKERAAEKAKKAKEGKK